MGKVILGAAIGLAIGCGTFVAITGGLKTNGPPGENELLASIFVASLYCGPFMVVGAVAGATHAIVRTIERPRRARGAPCEPRATGAGLLCWLLGF